MPVVKRFTGQVKAAPAPFIPQKSNMPVSKSSGASSEFGRTIAAVGDKAAGLYIKQQKDMDERADKAAAKDAYVLFGDTLRKYETDYRNREKNNARGSTSEAQKDIDETMFKMSGALENDRQRELFKTLANSRRGSFLDTQADYESRQLKAWDLESSNAMADEAVQYAAENPYDKKIISDMEKQIDVAVDTAMPGSSGESVKNRREAQITKLHEAVINAMAVNDAAGAKKYYEENKKSIDGTSYYGIESKLKTVGVKQASQIKADEIVASGKSYEDQLEVARNIKDPEIRDATVSRLKVRKQETTAIEKEQRQKSLDATTGEILDLHKAGGSYEAARDLALGVANGGDRERLRQTVDRLFLKADGVTRTDKYDELMERIDNKAHKKGPINSVPQMVREYSHYLSNKDFTFAQNYWKSGGNIGGVTDARAKSIYKTLTGEGTAKKEFNIDKYNSIWNHVVENLPEGRKITDVELKELINQGLIAGERQGGGWGYGEDISYADAKQKGHGATWLPTVESNEEDRIDKLIKEDNAESGKNIPINKFTRRLYKRTYFLEIPASEELIAALVKEVEKVTKTEKVESVGFGDKLFIQN